VIRCIAKSPRTSLKEDSEDHLFNDKLDQANILDLMQKHSEDHLFNDKLDQANILDLMQKHVKLSKLLNMVLGD